MTELIMNLRATEKRVALKEQDKVVELLIERPTTEHIEGNIYKGRVVNVLPGMQAAFVDIGQKQPGYLHRDHLCSYQLSPLSKTEKEKRGISHFVHQGEAVLVQVAKEGEGAKGPKLTGLIEFPGIHIVYQPYGKFKAISKKMKEESRKQWREHLYSWCTEEEGVILRSASEHAPVPVVEEELAALQEQYLDVQGKMSSSQVPGLLHKEDHFLAKLLREIPKGEIKLMEVDDAPTFQLLKKQGYPVRFYDGKEDIFARRGIDQELEKALKRIVWLPSGGYIIIEHTEAMTVVDVNTGKYVGKTGLEQTVLKTNLEAAKEVARQLRLREIGGIVIVDFIDMASAEEQDQVLKIVRTEVKKDRSVVRIIGFTGLHLLQLTRKKIREPLTGMLLQKCEHCHGKGTVYSSETIAFQLERKLLEYYRSDVEAIIVQLTEDVKNILDKLPDLEKRTGVKIHYVKLPGKPGYEIVFTGSIHDAKDRLKSLEPY